MRHDLIKWVCYLLYYGIAIWLPPSYSRFFGKASRRFRYFLCKRIFLHCGTAVNIERGARFDRGFHLSIGSHSGIGVNSFVPDGSVIGEDVMMGPNCYIHSRNHRFDRTDIPMRIQGYTEVKPIIIEDDVWIGRDVTIMAGRHISKGSIIAANCVLTKDFPAYSVVGGNPGKIIRLRKEDSSNQS